MLLTKCLHPQLLSALAKLGHGSWILISDGGYPHMTASNPCSEKVFLNLAQGLLNVTQILEVLKETIPVEAAAVMTPPDGTMQPVFDEYKSVIPDTPFEYIKQFDFYERAKESNVGLLIASGDVRNYANLLIKVGFIRHSEGKGSYWIDSDFIDEIRKKINRVGGTGLFPVSASHITVRTVQYTVVL